MLFYNVNVYINRVIILENILLLKKTIELIANLKIDIRYKKW